MTQISHHFQQGGREAVITYDYVTQAVPGWDYSPVRTAEHAHEKWQEHVQVSQSSDCILTMTRCRLDSGSTGEWTAASAGQAQASAAPINTALIVRKQATVGRNGRFYVPGILESQIDAGGNVLAIALAAWQTSMDNYKAALEVGGYFIAVKNNTTAYNGRLPIQSLIVLPVVGTQRRRMRR